MNPVTKNWKIILLAVSLILAFGFIGIFGVQLGTDFKGGTVFQIHLAEKASPAQLQTISSVIEHRMDSFGLRDVSVSSEGTEFIRATIAETDAKQIESIERILRTQGKFEVLMDGNALFTGSEIIQIITDPANGYRVYQEGGSWRWVLPFVLTEDAAQNFSRAIFHRCTITGAGSGGTRDYECDKTYFFIDRPIDSVLIIPKSIYTSDSDIFSQGSTIADIPQETDLREFLINADAPYLLVDSNL